MKFYGYSTKNRFAYRIVALAVLACAVIACTVVARSLPPDPNNPTGTHGLVLVDKLGSRIRFLNPDTYAELSNSTWAQGRTKWLFPRPQDSLRFRVWGWRVRE